MNKIFKLLVVLAGVAALSACSKEWVESRTGLRLSVSPEDEYTVKAETGIDVGAFDVHIRKTTGEYDKTWKYAELPDMIELSEGKFNISVTSPERLPVAWNQPIYASEQIFDILDGTVTNLSLKCTIQNMKVTVSLSQNMIDELEYYEVRVENEDGFLLWKQEEIEAGAEGFFSVKPLKVIVSGRRKLDGSQAVKELKISDVASRDHHKVNVDAKVTGQTKVLDLVIDDSLVDKPVDVIVPGFDDVVPGGDTPGGGDQPVEPVAAPTLEWPANPQFERKEIVEGMDVNLIVKAPGRIKSFIVRVSKNFQSAISFVSSNPYLDLINDEKAIKNLGSKLPAGDQLKGKTSVDFPLSALIPLIKTVGEPGQDYVFTLEVEDEAGNQLSKSLTFFLPAA